MYILALNILNMCDDESNQHVEFIGSNVFLGNSKENCMLSKSMHTVARF